MSSRNSERDGLHGPWPSRPEELQAIYGDRFEIYRELLDGGRHGDWVARPLPGTGESAELRATQIDDLAEQLAAATSARGEATDE
ncbi:hypothetical protein GCM10029978_068240 [Actinoallomurus acanthiterrae]